MAASDPWHLSASAEEHARICIRAAEMRARGASLAAIRDELGLATPRDARRCADTGFGLAPGEDLRSGRRKSLAELDALRRELWKIADDPGPMTTVTGKLVTDEDGNTLPDRKIRIDALNALRAVNERESKLGGYDEPKRSVNVHASARLEDLQAAVEQMRAEVAKAERDAVYGGDDGKILALPPSAVVTADDREE